MLTSTCNVESEFEHDPTQVTAESGLVGAVHGNDGRIAGILTFFDQNDVVPRDSHILDTESVYLSLWDSMWRFKQIEALSELQFSG